jgi:hypothetical protein
MRRISSGWTFFYKRIFPIIWVGFLTLFAGIGVVKDQGPFPVIVPLVMIAFGYFLMLHQGSTDLRADRAAFTLPVSCIRVHKPPMTTQ